MPARAPAKMHSCRLFSYTFVVALVGAWDVARTPPMGFNTWNLYHCGVDAAVLNSTAEAMVTSGLFKAGYEFVNSDDCWMLANRTSDGLQIANPAKFPDGFKAVADYIHSLGLKSGLYTAKGTHTCARFAASCDHEVQDAAQWASWGIDYVKDDSCSSCDNKTDNQLYGGMWQAIQASNRAMVLTVEGNPDDALITKGGYGNAKRVGHDISPNWLSMTSLVDIGAGLWPFAHNSTNALYGGFWNDLDMIEVGNSPDFVCGADSAALERCRAHFTMWTIMKAPLILGNDIPNESAATLSVLSNADAIAVNQDALGVQAQRVSSSAPLTATAAAARAPVAVLARCDAARPTQRWALAADGALRTGGLCLVAERAGEEGGWSARACGAAAAAAAPPAAALRLGAAGELLTADGAALTFNNARGATGPLPHTRYILAGAGAATSAAPRAPRWAALPGGGLRLAEPALAVVDADGAGGLRAAAGGDWCLDAVPPGGSEVWAGPLTGGRWALALFNRGAAAAPITAQFTAFNQSAAAAFAVRDIWQGKDVGTFTGSYTATVASEATAYLVLTPA